MAIISATIYHLAKLVGITGLLYKMSNFDLKKHRGNSSLQIPGGWLLHGSGAPGGKKNVFANPVNAGDMLVKPEILEVELYLNIYWHL